MRTPAPPRIRYFHGGLPGLRVGDLVAPSAPNYLDDCPICQAKKAGLNVTVDSSTGHTEVIDPITGHPDRIYVTSDRDYARFYASKFPRGDLYVVDPVGEVEPSTEDHFPTWMVGSACVRGVYDRCVQLTWSQRRSLQRRWAAADAVAAQGGV